MVLLYELTPFTYGREEDPPHTHSARVGWGDMGIVGSVSGSERPRLHLTFITPASGEKQPQGSVAERGAPSTRLC